MIIVGYIEYFACQMWLGGGAGKTLQKSNCDSGPMFKKAIFCCGGLRPVGADCRLEA